MYFARSSLTAPPPEGARVLVTVDPVGAGVPLACTPDLAAWLVADGYATAVDDQPGGPWILLLPADAPRPEVR